MLEGAGGNIYINRSDGISMLRLLFANINWKLHESHGSQIRLNAMSSDESTHKQRAEISCENLSVNVLFMKKKK